MKLTIVYKLKNGEEYGIKMADKIQSNYDFLMDLNQSDPEDRIEINTEGKNYIGKFKDIKSIEIFLD